jgi:adenine-specific DNA methylase
MTEEKAPIEEYFPIEQVNEIADKESKAKRYYRPVYTMHKWWARRLGSVFRSMLLYSLADEDNMKVLKSNSKDGENKRLDTTHLDESNDQNLVDANWDGNPETLWNDFYLEDVSFEDKTVVDPFMGGGTTIVEALRMNANVVGKDLNPVAWFTVKKETEPVDLDKLDEAFEKLEEEVAPEIKKYYKTTCPECEETADAMYYFWVKELDCRNCGSTTPLFKDYRVAKNRSNNVEHKQKAICESCGETYKPGENCPHCGEEFQHKNYYHVHCPKCEEIFECADYKEETTCPYCENQFNPYNDGPAGGAEFTCTDSSCPSTNVLTAIEEQGKPEERLWAVEYYCSKCDMKGYKKAEKEDKDLYKEAAREFEENKNRLPIPQQEIPEGKETTPRLPNWGYEKFKDMFNDRQLLNLGKLLSEIKEIEDNKVREILTLIFSNTTDYNNMFCLYNNQRNHPEHLFLHHAYIPRTTPTENNLWGSEYGRGTFKKEFKMIREGVKYGNQPFEKYRENDETKETDMNISTAHDEEDDILCGDSSYLEIDDKSVDAIITDPPYFDNVMYSELSDFFYVWLREALKDEYDYFQSELAPKSAEAVKNSDRGKTEEDFTDSLTRVFAESRSKLKDEGLMAFTFHHGSTDAWASVLGSVLDSGFYISAIYPIQAEMSTSLHIQKKGNIEYDMIIVCRKRDDEPEEGIWSEMEDRIYLEAKEEVEKLRTEDRELTQGDMFVITIGKCLEIYSKHYPEVYRDGEKVSVSDALESIQEIVDGQIMGGMFDDLATELDLISATYISYIAGRGGEIGYSSLNKNLQQRSVDISDLTDSGVVKQEGSKVIVPDLEDRAEEIESKSEDNLTSVDRAQYLAYLKDEDRLASEMHDWASEGAVKALRKLGDIENNNDYIDLADYVEEKTKDSQLNL